MTKIFLVLYIVAEAVLYLFNICNGSNSSSTINTTYSSIEDLSTTEGCNGTLTNARCGTDWNDANNKCGTSCSCGVDRQCPDNEYCYTDLSEIPCYEGVFELSNFTIPTIGSCGTESVFPLAFDDGPWTTNNASLRIAQSLYERNISGTFFVSPAGVDANNTYELNNKCELIGRLLDYGHYVESHSWTHADFETLSYLEIVDELDTTYDFITKCARKNGHKDYYPTMFRPPYGRINVTQAKLIADMGYIIVLWNFDSLDYSYKNNFTAIESIFEESFQDYKNGSSISALFHDFGVFSIIDEIVDYILEETEYELINSKQCYDVCDTFDEYDICRDPNGLDWPTVSQWDATIAAIILNDNKTFDYVIDRLDDYDRVGDLDSTLAPTAMPTQLTTFYNDSGMLGSTEMVDEDENEEEDSFERILDWASNNIIYIFAIIGLSILLNICCCVYLCRGRKLCDACKDTDGFDEYFRTKHQVTAEPRDYSMQSQSQTA